MKFNLIFGLCYMFYSVQNFNIDMDNVVTLKEESGKYFGYSVVMFNNQDGNWVLVGAPKDTFTHRHEIKTPGNVYKCKVNLTTQEKCTPFMIRTIEDRNDTHREEDHQLLGASMAVFNESIVICAPLWKIMKGNIIEPVGRCYSVDKSLGQDHSTSFNLFYNESGNSYAQAGFALSSKALQDKQRQTVLIGAPGLHHWKGGFISLNMENIQRFQRYSHVSIHSDIKKAIVNNTLMGYSITTGKLAQRHDCSKTVVLGAPHFKTAEGITGSVLVVCLQTNKSMTVKKQVSGKMHGSGFGTALVFEDIDGDGLDDLIVGAPFNRIDSGEVYVYYGTDTDDVLVKSQQELTMSIPGRFGSAIQCVGDLNKDGYKDIAVGAPYQRDRRGSVYIYHGGPTSLTFTQEIRSEEVGRNLLSFGWFISTPVDIDQNGYTDFAVGSYMSDTVLILRTRPIIDLTCQMNITPSSIPLNSSGLHCQNENFHPCAQLDICFNYTGLGISGNIAVSYTIDIDTNRTKSVPSRVAIFANNTYHRDKFSRNDVMISKGGESCSSVNLVVPVMYSNEVMISKGGESCSSVNIVVPVMYSNDVMISKGGESGSSVNIVVPIVTRQFLETLTKKLYLAASFSLSENQPPGKLKPILNNKPTTQKVSAMFESGCDGTCYPNLKLTLTSKPEVIIFGRTVEIDIQLKVTNSDDQSHGTRFIILTSNNTDYLGFYQPQNEGTELGTCIDQMNASIVYCNLNKTFFQQQVGLFNLRYNVSRHRLTDQYIDAYHITRSVVYTVNVSSTSPDFDWSDNNRQLEVPIQYVSEIQLTGISDPEQRRLSAISSIEFFHTYYVYNMGPSPMSIAVVRVCLPVLSTQVLEVRVKSKSDKTTWNVDENGRKIDKMHEGETHISQKKKKPTFGEISCDTVDETMNVIYDVTIKQVDPDETIQIEFKVVLQESDLIFDKVSAILFKSTGEVITTSRRDYTIKSSNATFQVTSEIFPKDFAAETGRISLWIIIGGCLGGLALLVILGVVLWKVGFFQRKKKDDMNKWKRQSGYYASRNSQYVDHVPRQSDMVNSVHW
ncbi:integrin alpha-9-like isoform X3 [Mytilus californianus]|uniref:integrin alpha-9-like isoform X3 n=1 Tax=Mytilus californianus TaxID=6549 RepID=UPI002245CA3A|nr:integrin alpha-9-like isoform X3 [Mytilus californianus]